VDLLEARVNPFKSISFREPEPPRTFSFETSITANSHRHFFRDDHGCNVASFSFDSYDEWHPPPARERVLAACRALVDEQDVITDYGTEDDR
jgi:hypothetical protein